MCDKIQELIFFFKGSMLLESSYLYLLQQEVLRLKIDEEKIRYMMSEQEQRYEETGVKKTDYINHFFGFLHESFVIGSNFLYMNVTLCFNVRFNCTKCI